jgi:hypothetical protein
MTTNTFVQLKDCDVVCGRGGLANKHPGNRMLRRICNENKSLYQSSMNPTHKQCLILSILMAIQQHGGRFVAKGKEGWEEISDKRAKEKVAQLLRESTDAPSTVTTKPMAFRETKPVVTMNDGNSSTNMTTQAPVTRQPIFVSSPEPLPIMLHTRHVTPDTVPSGHDLLAAVADLIEPEPLPVPAAPVAPAPPRAFDDGDLFDLIPLEAADSYGMESNPEFQAVCHGLASGLGNVVAC